MSDTKKLTPEELGKLYPVFLIDYDRKWPELFEKEKDHLLSVLGADCALRIEHIGSTAVPGIKSKPTIDILVEIPENISLYESIIQIMMQDGYLRMEEQKKHLMFVKGYTPTGLAKESFHIHMGPAGLDWLWDRVYFRDYLRTFPETAKEYEVLKMALSEKYHFDREAYTDNKAAFIRRITNLAKQEIVKKSFDPVKEN